MSIDSFFYVPARTRNLPNGERSYKKYKRLSEFIADHGDRRFPHQVYWLAGGWIDEQYFFEDSADARWFYGKGWKFRDFLNDNGLGCGQPPTVLWIDDVEIKGADNNVPLDPAEEAELVALARANDQWEDDDARKTFGVEEAK